MESLLEQQRRIEYLTRELAEKQRQMNQLSAGLQEQMRLQAMSSYLNQRENRRTAEANRRAIQDEMWRLQQEISALEGRLR